MRTIKQLPVVQDGNDANFPDGQIRNETTTETGTPVVREIYGDILTNIYKILRVSGIAPTGTEDGETTQYQLVEALKVFTNKINDIQQLLTVDNADINSLMNFDNLPENYVFIGKTTEDLIASTNYTINGAGNDSYPVSPVKDIPASSIVICVLNQGGTTIVGINALSESENTIHTNFGTPLSFNSSNKVLYFSEGNIISEFPAVFQVQQIIRNTLLTNDVTIVDCILVKGKLICFTLNTTTLTYQAFSFDQNNLNALEGEITLPTVAGVDNQPYIYSDGTFIYFSNSQGFVNESVNDYDLGKFSFDEANLVIAASSSFGLDNSFEKTTNSFIDSTGNNIYTFIQGNLYRYDLGGVMRVLVGFFNTTDGVVFKLNGNTYYSNGSVATQWNY